MKDHRNSAPGRGRYVQRLANESGDQNRRRRSRRLRTGMLVSVMGLLLAFTPPLAGWRTSAQSLLCDVIQITNTTGGGNSSLAFTDDGAHLAFLSNRDLAGGNADGNFEIFLYNTQAGSFTQVTDSTEEEHFNGPGNKNAFLNRLEAIEQLILASDTDQALQELQNLRRRVDGCGTAADTNDWIVDCASQLQVRALIDMLITNLSS